MLRRYGGGARCHRLSRRIEVLGSKCRRVGREAAPDLDPGQLLSERVQFVAVVVATMMTVIDSSPKRAV